MAADTEETYELRDGTMIRVRPVVPEDTERLRAGLARLSPESRYARFMAPMDKLTESQLRYLCDVDQKDHIALGATIADDASDSGIGVARCIRLKEEPTVAEVAVTVLDDMHGRGLGTLLLDILARAARKQGIETFRAYVLGENRGMIQIFGKLGAKTTEVSGGVVTLDVPLPASPDELPDTTTGRVFKEIAKRPSVQTIHPMHVSTDE
jgi:GNAT superfamily N-acetyltransferase